MAINPAGIEVDSENENTEGSAEPGREWFIGAYVTRELKSQLQSEAKREHRTLSQQLIHILTERYQKEIAQPKGTETHGTP